MNMSFPFFSSESSGNSRLTLDLIGFLKLDAIQVMLSLNFKWLYGLVLHLSGSNQVEEGPEPDLKHLLTPQMVALCFVSASYFGLYYLMQ